MANSNVKFEEPTVNEQSHPEYTDCATDCLYCSLPETD